jgi:phosphoribosylformylglycinamidine cyclo-ligase
MSGGGQYDRRGVSSAKEDVHRAVRTLDRGLYPEAFCRLLPDVVAGDEEAAFLMHADGAGTKSTLAYLWWRETGDPAVFRGLAQDATVMNLDDMLCAGATGPFVLSSTIGRNKALIPGDVLEAIIVGFHDFARALAPLGVEVALGGGETADLGDLVRTVVVDATCCARIPRARVIDNAAIRPGDLILGLASTGRAAYETAENSGIGSNGLTSARHDLLARAYGEKYPETVCPETPPELVYCGPYRLEDRLPESDLSVGEALLSPTRTYAPVLAEVLREGGPALIHGLIHATGGGQTKCLHFGTNVRYVKDDLFLVPPLFQAIQAAAGTPWKEMYEVFNMGHRMEVYTGQEGADLVRAAAARHGVGARVIGRVERAAEAGRELIIASPEGTLTWRR